MRNYREEFDRCAQWLEPSLEFCNGCYDLESIWDACMRGQMQLWPGVRSALVTELVKYPLRKGCVVAFAGGDLTEIMDMRHDIEAWAKTKGCDFIAVNGRKGWARALGVGRIVSTTAARDLT